MSDLLLPADPAQLVAGLQAHVAAAPFNAWAGFTVVEAEPGRVVVGFEGRPELTQIGGHLHAAVQCGVLEIAAGLSVATKVGPIAVTSFTTSFVARAVGTRFTATGEAVRAGRRQGFATAELHAWQADGTSQLVAQATAVMVPVA